MSFIRIIRWSYGGSWILPRAEKGIIVLLLNETIGTWFFIQIPMCERIIGYTPFLFLLVVTLYASLQNAVLNRACKVIFCTPASAHTTTKEYEHVLYQLHLRAYVTARSKINGV